MPPSPTRSFRSRAGYSRHIGFQRTCDATGTVTHLVVEIAREGEQDARVSVLRRLHVRLQAQRGRRFVAREVVAAVGGGGRQRQRWGAPVPRPPRILADCTRRSSLPAVRSSTVVLTPTRRCATCSGSSFRRPVRQQHDPTPARVTGAIEGTDADADTDTFPGTGAGTGVGADAGRKVATAAWALNRSPA